MSKKPLIVWSLLIAAGAGAYWWTQGGDAPKSESELTLYGNVDIREVNMAFGTTEHIGELLVEEGERVKAGQVLGRLETGKLEAAVAAAEAQAAAQEQTLGALRAGSRSQEIRRARAQADALKAKARTAQITFQRQQKLARQKLVAPEDLDQARAAADAAEAEAEAAEQTYGLAVAGPRAEEIAYAEAQLRAQRAKLALAREQLADATLKAPATGIVRERILQPGDMASPQTPALTLALMNPLWVRAYVPEPDLGRIVPGARATVTTDSFPGKVYRGWVGFISPTAEFTPKNVETPDLRTRLVYQVRVFVCNPDDELRLGMPATVTIPLDQPGPGAWPAPDGADPCGN
ncbi:MAG: efflux RND transporter periplasmic adaptor subunit [Thiocapsa sp.]|nr:efflux RND transporter periplasmic adaptor subunit [Thiocapsa sp.]MCG6897868.1 efflux RND transporter periplasmic adaptor subunit [Thiocapsa sp.]